tara:strand:+ start:5801 stop:6376 length:576 start_codon:yes stop_codon:yes gene_type:complete
MFDLPKNEIIYVSCSGGADSSLLLFELTEYHKDRDIRPIHFYKEDVPLYVRKEKMRKIYNLISKLNNYKFKNVYYRKTSSTNHLNITMSDFEKFHKKHKGFSMIGVTKNPNLKFDEKTEDYDRQGDTYKNLDMKETPYFKFTKRELAQKYYHNSLHNNLFPLTFSCIVNTEIHCEECWWCKERMWAFGRII